MKIAVPTRANAVDDHFGYCLYFTIFTAEKGQIVEETILETIGMPGHNNSTEEALKSHGVDVVLAGEVTDSSLNRLSSNGIKVISGCRGCVREVIKNYLSGSHVLTEQYN